MHSHITPTYTSVRNPDKNVEWPAFQRRDRLFLIPRIPSCVEEARQIARLDLIRVNQNSILLCGSFSDCVHAYLRRHVWKVQKLRIVVE